MSCETDTGIRPVLPPTNASAQTDSYSVVIAYDEVAGGQRAMEMFIRLQRETPGAQDFHCDLWRFDLLTLPGVSDAALLAGMQAKIIIIAARAEIDLPSSVKSWLSQSTAGKLPGSAALVALLHSRRESLDTVSPSHATIEMAARRRGLQFFAQESRQAGGDVSRVITGLRDMKTRVSSGLEKVRPNPPRPAHWGINE
jgi:hypothetical protein